MKISFLEGEVWYPAVSSYGTAMPYTKEFTGKVKFRDNPTPNQMTPLLLSNKGRLVYKEDGFNANFSKGSLETDVETTFVEGLVTLREAYKYAVKHYFDKEGFQLKGLLIQFGGFIDNRFPAGVMRSGNGAHTLRLSRTVCIGRINDFK